jgi:signal transduction histidine kinase
MTSAIAQLQPNRDGSPDPDLLLAAVHGSPDSLAIVASGLIVYANPAWCGMFECADGLAVQGRPVEEWVPAQSVCVRPAAALHAVPDATQYAVHDNDEGEPLSGTQFVHTRKNGVRLHLEVTRAGFELRGREFQVIHPRDISLQKRAERQLLDAQTLEAIGRMAGGVAHDFNNLLTGIMLYCDLLIAELEKGSPAQRHAHEVRIACEHGAALVQQLLAVARPPAGVSRVFALNDVVRGLGDLLTRLVGENIVLNTSLASDLGPVRMDPGQAQQILLNLALNARDAMPDGGQITLTTRNADSWVELTVTDTGCGMDTETLDRAFEPFFTTKKPGRGSGLGLATARRLARQEGGTIVAESELGKGTRVSMLLPRVRPDPSTNSKTEVIL